MDGRSWGKAAISESGLKSGGKLPASQAFKLILTICQSVDPEAHVRSPLKPKPGLRSGAIALPEPEEREEQVTIKSVRLR
jgi:hypothetical protein